MSCNCRGGPTCCMRVGGAVWSDAFGWVQPPNVLPDVGAPKAPVVDMFEDVRRWVAAIGSTNLDTGRRITKADALLVIDRMLEDFR